MREYSGKKFFSSELSKSEPQSLLNIFNSYLVDIYYYFAIKYSLEMRL